MLIYTGLSLMLKIVPLLLLPLCLQSAAEVAVIERGKGNNPYAKAKKIS
jgi:hypothetical protein